MDPHYDLIYTYYPDIYKIIETCHSNLQYDNHWHSIKNNKYHNCIRFASKSFFSLYLLFVNIFHNGNKFVFSIEDFRNEPTSRDIDRTNPVFNNMYVEMDRLINIINSLTKEEQEMRLKIIKRKLDILSKFYIVLEKNIQNENESWLFKEYIRNYNNQDQYYLCYNINEQKNITMSIIYNITDKSDLYNYYKEYGLILQKNILDIFFEYRRTLERTYAIKEELLGFMF